jgi:aminomethyltransferase
MGTVRIVRADPDAPGVLVADPTSDTDLLHTPLYDLHVSLGARLVPFAGYALPVQYPDGIMAEHLWTRQSAGLFDVSHMGQVVLRGQQAASALEALVPGDITGLAVGQVRYSLLLDAQGGILDDLMITNRGHDLFVIVNGAVKQQDIAVLQAGLEPDTSVTYLDGAALLALQGPKAVDALARLAPGCTALTFMKAAAMDVAGVPAWVSRSGYTGEDGFEIAVAGEHGLSVAQALLDQPEVKPIGLGARDSLRLEAGLPLYGHDISTETTPIEADLGFAISKRRKTGRGFPGDARIMDQLLAGAPRRRVGLRVEGRQPAREGAQVFAGDTQVGIVTSGGFAPSLQAPIAMALVASGQAEDGTRLEIDVRGRRLPAVVAAMPFVPHRYVRGTR